MQSSPHSCKFTCESLGSWGLVTLKTPCPPDSRIPLHRNNVGLSAVCAYTLATVEAVFSRGKYMQSATVEQSHTKWVRYNGPVPTPRPGAVSRVSSSGEGSSSLWLSRLPKHETTPSASWQRVEWQQESEC